MRYRVGNLVCSDELYHFGIPGMAWGRRRFQNEDGTYTAEGRARYGIGNVRSNTFDTSSGNKFSKARDSLTRSMNPFSSRRQSHGSGTYNPLADQMRYGSPFKTGPDNKAGYDSGNGRGASRYMSFDSPRIGNSKGYTGNKGLIGEGLNPRTSLRGRIGDAFRSARSSVRGASARGISGAKRIGDRISQRFGNMRSRMAYGSSASGAGKGVFSRLSNAFGRTPISRIRGESTNSRSSTFDVSSGNKFSKAGDAMTRAMNPFSSRRKSHGSGTYSPLADQMRYGSPFETGPDKKKRNY